MLTNEQRKLLGLNELSEEDGIMKLSKPTYVKDVKIYIRENKVIKLTFYQDCFYKEIDYEIPLDAEKKIIGRKGSKSKPITFDTILNCKTKKMRLKVDTKYPKYMLKVGITHFKIMYFEATPTLNDFQKNLTELYGSLEQWEKLKLTSLKNVKSRYIPKEGDIFSYPITNNEYGFALIISSFARLRKHQLMPKDRKHYLNQMMGVPLIIRSFDFISDKNQIELSILREYSLLNPEIIMDDHVLRGDYPVIGNTELQMEDIKFPMSFSFNGKSTTYQGYRVAHRTPFETLNLFQKDLTVRFDWGFGSVIVKGTDFLNQKFSKNPIFKPISGLGWEPCSLVKKSLVTPETVLSNKEIQEIFQLLNIESEIDFDEFNKKFGGITRQEYLKQLETTKK